MTTSNWGWYGTPYTAEYNLEEMRRLYSELRNFLSIPETTSPWSPPFRDNPPPIHQWIQYPSSPTNIKDSQEMSVSSSILSASVETTQGAFGYLQDNLINKVLVLETDAVCVFTNYEKFMRLMNQAVENINDYSNLKHSAGNLKFFIEAEADNKNISYSDIWFDSNEENRSNLMMKIVPGMPKLATLIRSFVHSVKRAMDRELSSRDDLKTIEERRNSFLFHQMQLAMWDAVIPNTKEKTTFLDRFLAENVQTIRGTKMKCLISNSWPRYRGMFGDHRSCFYPERDHEAGMQALMRFGYIATFYEENVSDDAILKNFDNPLLLDEPLDTNRFDDDYDDKETMRTDGCAARALILPVATNETKAARTFKDDQLEFAVINGYLHSKKCPSFSRAIVAQWLSTLIPDSHLLGKRGIRNTDELYINGGLGYVVSSRRHPLDQGPVYLCEKHEMMINHFYSADNDNAEYMAEEGWDEVYYNFNYKSRYDTGKESTAVSNPSHQNDQTDTIQRASLINADQNDQADLIRTTFAESIISRIITRINQSTPEIPISRSSFSHHPSGPCGLCIHYGLRTAESRWDCLQPSVWTALTDSEARNWLDLATDFYLRELRLL